MAKRAGCAKVKRMLKLKEAVDTPAKSEEDMGNYMNEDAFRINQVFTPPYNVIVDTNFVNFCIRRKIDLHKGLLNCLLANVKLFVTECVIGELEKLGRTYRVALALVKDKTFTRMVCSHRGTYADDCILGRVKANRCYIVATCDSELKQRIRKVPGVPIVSVKGARIAAERLPHAPLNPRR